MTKARSIKLNTKKLFWGLVISCALFLFAYIYLVNAVVVYASKAKTAQNNFVELQSEVSELEYSYMDAQKKLTRDLAYSKGLSEVESSLFVDASSAAKLSLQHENE